ncbi:MAG: hypothetical protein JWP63_5588, partial [Candidatus Solibacter sp.]|nr:hypothetical protein [Candidatus Solibacter sp.]
RGRNGAAPGLRFHPTPPGGKLETVRQSIVEFLRLEHAQVAIKARYFLPWPPFEPEASLVGKSRSNRTRSRYTCRRSISMRRTLRLSCIAIPRSPTGSIEAVKIGDAVSASAQIVTDGVKTIPRYQPDGVLVPDARFSGTHSWYDVRNARSAIGITRDAST